MQLSYELSSADLGVAQALFWRKRRPLFFWGFSVYGAFFALFGLWLLVRGNVSSAIVPLVFGAWAIAFVPFLLPRSARKSWSKMRFLHGPTLLSTSDEGMEVSNSMSRSLVRWEVFDAILEGKEAWLLCIGPLNYYIVPTRAFANEEEKTRFRSELHRVGSPVSSVVSSAPLASP